MEPELSPETFGVRADLATLALDQRLIWTAVLAAVILVVRFGLLRAVRGQSELLSDAQRRWMLIIRNVASGVMVLGLIWIWAEELRTFAFSIAAFAVAIVIATKELILCFVGGLVRSATGAYTVGDWIEVGPHSGEVVEIFATVTQLQEFDRVAFEHTGRLITVPNSQLLVASVVNHSFRKRFIFHEFAITAEPFAEAAEARAAIEAALAKAAGSFADVASRYRHRLERGAGITLPAAEPQVRIRTSELAKLRFEARLFCPRDRAADMERIAMDAFLSWAATQPWRFAGTNPLAAEAAREVSTGQA